MNLSVALLGHTADWRFAGSDALRAWLESSPWFNGGVRLLSLSEGADVTEIESCLRRAVRGMDDGLSGVRVLHLRAAPAEGPLQTLEAELGLRPVGTRRARLGAAASAFAGLEPRLITIAPEAPVTAAFWDEAETLADQMNKIEPTAVIAWLVLERTQRPSVGGAFDYLSGQPVSAALDVFSSASSTAWAAYLHTRAGWECGGRLPTARTMAEATEAKRPLAQGNDGAVEKWLNEVASALWDKVPAPSRTALANYLDDQVRAKRSTSAVVQDLRALGLLQEGFGSAASLPSPWAARALLLKAASPVAAPLLGASLVCAPLARELLGRCFELEAHARIQLWADVQSGTPGNESISRYADFSTGGHSFESDLYPAGCPARPRSPWAFASFGEYLKAAAPTNRQGPLTRLRLLRNALAHGHYASWHAVREVQDIATALRT